MENPEEDTCYVYLEFNEKLTPSIFANKMFLRIANLHKPHPLVQINDLLFKGSYDECVGTNIFFEEEKDPPLPTSIFEKQTPIHLKPTIVQTKTIKLKQVKLPRQAPTKQCRESIALNLNQKYNTILDKLDQGILEIEDLGYQEPQKILSEQFEDMTFNENDESGAEPQREIDSVLENARTEVTAASILEAKYERLRRLACRPVKRMTSSELVEECEPQHRQAYEFDDLEKQICQTSVAFRSVSGPILEKSFIGGIDVERCVLQGLLPSTLNFNHALTKEEQRKILTLDNFENLSLPARYLVLKEYVAQIEELIENTSVEELTEVDENGRTIADICEIFRRLVRSLELTMAQSNEESRSQCHRTDLNNRPEEEYVKYRYNPDNDVIGENQEIFNYEAWIAEGVKSQNEEQEMREVVVQSDESMDEGSD